MELTRSANSSFRRNSFISSSHLTPQVDNDVTSETVSEAGDIGDRALHSFRRSESGSIRRSFDRALEDGLRISILEGERLRPYPALPNSGSTVIPLSQDFVSPQATNGPEDKNNEPNSQWIKFLEYSSCLTHLAVFGIFGVLTRYLLEKLFSPAVADVTNDQTILYLDLPPNMVGSFLMGWFGVVFKGDIVHVSDNLAIGLSTGYLGSLTTFSGWNQKMLDLSVSGNWVLAVLGFLIGLFLVAFSIIFGVETAKGFRWLLNRKKSTSASGNSSSRMNCKVVGCRRQLVALGVCLIMLGILWGVSCALLKDDFNAHGSKAPLWLACIVGPLGVWIRWFLARLNGRGLGRAGLFKWIPFGTLSANISAACVMAALATLKKAVSTEDCDIVATGLQFGFLGCLSTVSTFAAEFNAMRESIYPWRAYAYAMMTMCVSFGLGTLIYSVPVWTKGYK